VPFGEFARPVNSPLRETTTVAGSALTSPRRFTTSRRLLSSGTVRIVDIFLVTGNEVLECLGHPFEFDSGTGGILRCARDANYNQCQQGLYILGAPITCAMSVLHTCLLQMTRANGLVACHSNERRLP